MGCSALDRAFFEVLRRRLSKTQFENFVLLLLAKTLGHSCILWRLAVSVVLPISVEAAYQRLKRLLASEPPLQELQQAWVRIVSDHFGKDGKRLTVLLDWTMHADRFRSLWAHLAVGMGRGIPLCFWMHANDFGGEGRQRRFEDDALRQLRGWLPQGCPVLLVADRGFGGRDRMRFVQEELGWQFVFRVTGDGKVRIPYRRKGKRGWRWRVRWQRVDARPPEPGDSWAWENAHYGKGNGITVNLFASRAAAPARGKTSGVWYLASNCPIDEPVALLYAMRMQVEESFRDMKAGFGLEHERTKDPVKRLRWQMLALTVLLARQTVLGHEELSSRGAQAEPDGADPRTPSAFGPRGRYRNVSDLRRGQQALLSELILQEDSELRHLLREIAAKSKRMQQRPQVKGRRKAIPTRNRKPTAAIES